MRREIASNLPNATPSTLPDTPSARRNTARDLGPRAMQLRHDRRRRLFSDDTDVSSGKTIPLSSGASSPAEGSTSAYTPAAERARHRAVCSLVPARLLTLGLALGVCLALVGACLALHVAYPAMALNFPADDVDFLRLEAPGSLGQWLASTLLATAGALALFIYSLRRHRIDDYHGRYRMWIWIFAVCLIASLTETTGLGQLARAVCRQAAAWASVRSDVLCWATFGLVVAAIGLRLFFEIRRSRGAIAALLTSALAFLTAAAANTYWPAEWSADAMPILARGVWLAGYVLVLATFLLYARYIQLEVTGVVAAPAKRKRAKPKTRKRTTTESDTPEPVVKPRLHVQTDLDPVDTSTTEPPSRARKSDDERGANTDSEADESPMSKKQLSKAERRRLRREARVSRMAS